jgi:hypothetical protein
VQISVATPAGVSGTRDARHSDRRLEFVSILHPVAMEPPANARKQMEMTMKKTSNRDLSADELGAVSGGSPVSVPAHTFDKLLAAIDKNLEMVKQLKPGGYLPPG